MSIQVPLNIKEVYKLLCPKCKKKLEALAKDKIAQALTKNVLEGKGDKRV